MTLRQKGFTIVELLIATMAFSVILLVLMAGLLQIGRTYYKGLTGARTQEVARNVIDDVSRSIQFNGGQVQTDAADPKGYCIGNRMYSYVLNQQVNSTTRALVASQAPAAGCNAQNINGPLDAGSQELLAENMRLGAFDIADRGNGLYEITVEVGYGDYDLFEGTAVPSDTTPDLPLKCKGQGSSGQFCSVSRLSTTVKKRV